ncbi:MAG: (2Fe-2S) ferredoxin domain-containing protein, partial [Planctomycetes bacterium]|nr:(2Fe-2S) ferredoxin domain-containing protein [Planctomycetota bacterium]
MSDRDVKEIRVGLATCGVASGGRPVHDALREAARRSGLAVPVKAVGCSGMCHQEPIVEVVSADGRREIYGGVGPA